MRIALLHPTYWPEVTRGSERLVHDLATTLVSRGHEVTVLTSHPGRSTTSVENGVSVVRRRRLPQPPTYGLHEEFLGNVPNVARGLLRGGFDLAHAFHLTDAWAATRLRRWSGPPVVFSFHGMPTRHHLVARRNRLEMLQAVVSSAAVSAVLSEAAARLFQRYLLHRPKVLPGGVIADDFSVDSTSDGPPTILCAASLGDPRKRAGFLAEAFTLLCERRPDVRLHAVRTRDPLMSPDPVELPSGADWIEAESTAELARAFAGATASVLTSIDEPFGLVLIESLAAGTPVVAAASGAAPEIVDDRAIGRLFDPDDPAACARAMGEALDLASVPETDAACRRRAAEFDWANVVELYEEAYEEASGGGRYFSQ